MKKRVPGIDQSLQVHKVKVNLRLRGNSPWKISLPRRSQWSGDSCSWFPPHFPYPNQCRSPPSFSPSGEKVAGGRMRGLLHFCDSTANCQLKTY